MKYAQYDALIFDCDGTLADSMPVHYLAWVEVLGNYGYKLDENLFYDLGGVPSWKVVEHVALKKGEQIEEPKARKIADEKEENFQTRLQEVEPIKIITDIVDTYFETHPMGVATGGVHVICRAILAHIGIAEKLPVVVTSEDVTHGKPKPDIYLEAARQLGVNPKKCLAFEDAVPGIEAASAAGMEVFDVRTVHSPKRWTSS